jgi:hypothetical protein
MNITIRLGPGETIRQALIRAGLIAAAGDVPNETITFPPGTYITGPNLKQTRIIERRTNHGEGEG